MTSNTGPVQPMVQTAPRTGSITTGVDYIKQLQVRLEEEKQDVALLALAAAEKYKKLRDELIAKKAAEGKSNLKRKPPALKPNIYSTEDMKHALTITGGLIYSAARVLGCAHTTMENRIAADPDLKAHVDKLRGELLDDVETTLASKARAGEPWAVGMVLYSLGKNRGYVNRQELTGKDGGPIQTEETGGLTDEERATRIASVLERARAKRNRELAKQSEMVTTSGASNSGV